MSARIAIGFGASTAAQVEDVVQLIAATLGSQRPDVPVARAVVATVDRRAALAREVGSFLGCSVVTFDAVTLARVSGVVSESARARATVGTASVAEAAALAALGPRARLVAARATGRHCTCAIAEMT